jgi:superfamily II RNA helicase
MSELQFEHLVSTDVDMPENPAITFPFKCDPFQLHAFNSIEQGKHILVSVPTSSGKTCCAEYAIYHHIRNNKRIIYTSPIKSLSNEKYKEFKDKNICSVGLLTGDNKINPEADLIIATAEILRNALFQLKENADTEQTNILNNVGCVIMDEVHFINEPERGNVWEESLILLDDSIKLVLLSATIDRVTEFAKWIQSIKRSQLSLIQSNRRIIPLSHSIFIDDINKKEGNLFTVLDNNDKFMEDVYYDGKRLYDKMKKDEKYKLPEISQINSLVKFLIKNDLTQTIFFSFSRNKCEEYANAVHGHLIDGEQQIESMQIFDRNIEPYKKIYESLPQFIKVRQLIQKGVAFHHSGLIPILKEIIEIIFKKGLIKILFATETFAVGVNMPTRSVVFTNLSKKTNTGRRFLNTAEYKQMSGRAGRRGLDTMGTVILMSMYEYPDLNDLKSVMIKTMPSISSKFKIDYNFYLKSLNSTNTDPVNLFKSSLLSSELNSFYKNDKKIYEETEKKLNESIELNKIDSIVYELCEKIYSQNNLDQGFGFKVKLSQKQKKDLDKLKSTVNQQTYNSYLEIKNLKEELKKYENSIVSNNEYLEIEMNKLNKILNHFKLIDENYNLTPKGVLASLVNDCNGILLSEIISRGILDKLDTNEIVAIISIFASPPRTDNDDVYLSENLKEEYKQIQNIIDEYNKKEKEEGFYLENQEYWYVTNKYIDLTLNWVKTDLNNLNKLRLTTIDLLNYIEEYEGNFVKNMLKIYNIICNLKTICNIIKNFELLQKIEKIDDILLKDIVNVNSLYLK